MITYVKSNLFDLKVDAYVNPVNCVGVMGGGLAAEFKERYHFNYQEYRRACLDSTLAPGKCLAVRDDFLGKEAWIINFPTKVDWRNPSQYSYILEGLVDLVSFIKTSQTLKDPITSIAIPALGCGLGGLEWDKVRPMIHEKLKSLRCDIYVTEPM